MTSLGVVAHTIEDDEEWLIKLWEVNYIMSYDILYNFSMRWAIVLSSKKRILLNLNWICLKKLDVKQKRVTCASCKNGTSNGIKACMEGLVFSKGNLV